MKHLTTKLLIFILFVLTLLSAYNYFQKPFADRFKVEQKELSQNQATPTPSKVPKKELSTRDKIAQLLVVPLDLNDLENEGTASAKMLNFIENYDPGFVLYFGEQISTSAAALATTAVRSSFAETDYVPLIAVDHEGGLVQRLSGEGFTKLEAWQKVVETYTPAQQKAVYNQSSRELLAAGINIVFAPVVDLASASAVLQSRAASDLDLTVNATTNFIYSFSQNGIMPVIKHFPGIGSISRDPHYAASTISLKNQDTAIFGRILDVFGNIGVMSTHVRLTDKFAGKVCSLSEECLGKFLELYPRVLLFSDDLSMKAARAQLGTSQEKDLPTVAVEAVRAGNNALIFGKGVETQTLEQVIYALQKEYEDSESFRQKVETSLGKILNLKK